MQSKHDYKANHSFGSIVFVILKRMKRAEGLGSGVGPAFYVI
jgi:hypothetical protein